MKILILTFIITINTFVLTAQSTAIPDLNFEQALIDIGVDDNIDGQVLTSNINNITGLNIESKNINSLQGIEDFISLTHISCNYNNITELDLSNNVNLEYLDIYGNELVKLNVTANSELKHLDCSDNELDTLDLSFNLKLEYLHCSNNNIINFDISNNLLLTNLNCSDMKLNSLDISNHTLLEALMCFNNNLTRLDLSTNSKLTFLNCTNNQLTYLNINNGNNTNIGSLLTSYNSNLIEIIVDDSTYSNTNWRDFTFIDLYSKFIEQSVTNTEIQTIYQNVSISFKQNEIIINQDQLYYTSINVYNILGEIIYKQDLSENISDINLLKIIPNILIVQLYSENNTKTFKIKK